MVYLLVVEDFFVGVGGGVGLVVLGVVVGEVEVL